MKKLACEFIENEKRRGLKLNTLKDHELILNDFFDFIEENFHDIEDITDITGEAVLSFEKYLTVKKGAKGNLLSANRRCRYVSVVKKFFSSLEKEEKIYKNPASNVSYPKQRKRIIRDVLTVEEMDMLIKSCKGDTLMGLRDRAILELLYSTGIRADELANILIEDIDLNERVLFVRKGKLGSQRTIPFGESAKYWVERYLNSARPLIPTTSVCLFVTLQGDKFRKGMPWSVVKRYAKKSGIKKNVSTHTFRHTCATHMLKGKADIRYVQKQLGHRDIATTEKYLKIEISDLKEIHERCHPREQDDW